METLTIEAPSVVEIPEVAATNEIVPYEPPQTALEPATPDTDIVDTTWRVVDDKPGDILSGDWQSSSRQTELAPFVGAPALHEPKPYTLNQQLADEWERNGWWFERPTNELSVGEQIAQMTSVHPATAVTTQSKTALKSASSAPVAGPAPASRHHTRLGTPGMLSTAAGSGLVGIGCLFDWLFDLLTLGMFHSGNSTPRYTPAKRILFVTRLDFGETLGAYLVGEGLPLQVEGMEDRKANMPEYLFSISANHLRWGLRLMRDYGCDVAYDKERELWEVLPT